MYNKSQPKASFFLLLAALASLSFSACQAPSPDETKENTINLLQTHLAFNLKDSTVNALIEISAGSIDKWEVNKKTGQLAPDSIDGKPRKIDYLPYPANYGMIPQTLLPKELGGDGDPLDILVLGPAVPRGSLVKCKVLGVLKLLDGGEVDDKLIGISIHSPFRRLQTFDSLQAQYPGITEIVELWFTHYKGKEKMQSLGYSDELAAQKILRQAIKAYGEARKVLR